MTLIYIILATLAAGIGSVWLAAILSFGALARYTQHMLSMAAGALLATAFMHLMPEAFESQAGARALFATLLAGLIFFFLLDKAELWHHGHEHSHNHDHIDTHGHSAVHAHVKVGHNHNHNHSHSSPSNAHTHAPKAGSWAILTGDSVHCFGDGILIASAFMADAQLGWVAALAVLSHEVPHHMGDLVVMNRGNNQRMALIKVSMAGAITAVGGLAGYWLVEQLQDYLPFFLVIASSSFIYVALADLIPQLQKRLSFKETLAQIAWLVVGVALVTAVSALAH
jgi:zinc and cadmium transporter